MRGQLLEDRSEGLGIHYEFERLKKNYESRFMDPEDASQELFRIEEKYGVLRDNGA